MSLISIADKYEKIIKKASSQAYGNILKIHSLAETLALDPYNEKDDKDAAEHKSILNLATSFADKAYKQGLSADQVRSYVDQLKQKVYSAMLAAVGESKKELSNLMTALNAQMFVDVPSQVKRPEQGIAYNKPKQPEYAGDFDSLEEKRNEMAKSDVVKDLLKEQHPTNEEYYGLDPYKK